MEHGTDSLYRLKFRLLSSQKVLPCFFVVDSGTPLTSFGEETAKALFGGTSSYGDRSKLVIRETLKQSTYLSLLDIDVPFTLSGKFSEQLKDVNLLGSRFLFNANMSIIISPYEFDDGSEKMKIFYLAPYSMINEANVMAGCSEQSVDVEKRLKIQAVNKNRKSGLTTNAKTWSPKIFNF